MHEVVLLRNAECGMKTLDFTLRIHSLLHSAFRNPHSAFLPKVRPGSAQDRDPVERRPETTCSTENLHANTPWLDPGYQGQLHNNPNCNSKLARPGARAVHPAVFLSLGQSDRTRASRMPHG